MGFFRRKTTAELDLTDFDQAIRALASKHAPANTDVIDGPDDTLVIGSSTTNLTNLRKKWHDHEASDRLGWLDEVVAAMLQSHDESPSLDPSQLRAGVRSRATYELSNLHLASRTGGPLPATIPLDPIAGDLAWALIWDQPTTMQPVNTDLLDEWGYSFDELLQVGKANTATHAIEGWTAMNQAIFSPAGGDDYTCSLAFLPGALDALPLAGEKVVFHPTRSVLFVVRADDPESIRIAAELTMDRANDADPLSLRPIVGSDGNWRPLELAYTHPAFGAVKTLEVIEASTIYNDQTALLQTLVGDDVFVAKYTAVQNDAGEVVSMCTWSEGVETLLPDTDLISFFQNPSIPHFTTPRAAVEQICGSRLETTAHYPCRSRVSSFPNEDELVQLRAAAFEL